MADNYIKTLDFDSIEKSKKQIIESFVSIYGEDRREEIEEKITKVEIIPYMSIESLKNTIKTIKQNKSTEIVERANEILDPDLIKEFFSKIDFEDSAVLKYYDFVDKVKETGDRNIRLPFELISIDKTIDANAVLDNNPTEMMKTMDRLRPYIMDLRDEYEETLDKIKDKQEMLDKAKSKEAKLKDKYVFELATKYKDYLGDEYNKIVENFNKGKLNFSKHPKLDNLIGYSFSSMPPIDFFDEKTDKDVDYYAKLQRVKYFKNMGIDLGDDYSAYENDERCKQMWPSIAFAEQVKKDREEESEKLLQEAYLSYPPYTSAVERIAKHQPLEDMRLFESFFSTGATALFPNVKRGENGLESMPFIFINMARSEPDKIDMAIFHELNHLIEYKPLTMTEEGFGGVSGWDAFEESYSGEVTEGKRQYELFSEIINDLLAEKVARDFHSKGNSIVSDPNTAKYSVCGYRATTFLVNEFFEKFYDKIVASRSGNIEAIFEVIGKENFDELNSLFKEYDINFGGLKLLQFASDKREGKETDATRKMAEIERRRDETLVKMEEYSKTPMVM